MALTILSTVLVALGGLMFQAARHTRHSAAAGYRSAAITSAAAWGQALPWDSLPSAVGCVNQSVGQFSYARCTTVTAISPKLSRVRITIAPTGALTAVPDTVVIDRNKPQLSSPFNVN